MYDENLYAQHVYIGYNEIVTMYTSCGNFHCKALLGEHLMYSGILECILVLSQISKIVLKTVKKNLGNGWSLVLGGFWGCYRKEFAAQITQRMMAAKKCLNERTRSTWTLTPHLCTLNLTEICCSHWGFQVTSLKVVYSKVGKN